MGPLARQARQHIFKLGKLYLHLGSCRFSPYGKNLQNQAGTVNYLALKGLFKISCLHGRKVVIDNNNIDSLISDDPGKLIYLPAANIRCMIRELSLLNNGSKHIGACGICKKSKFFEILLDLGSRYLGR